MQTREDHHKWKFFRAGGFDQVLLETAEDLLALKHLDNKLWSALCCPVKGIHFDRRTVELIDIDGDGYIRPPEILAAIEWVERCLQDVRYLVDGGEEIPLAAISSSSDEGIRILATARTVLQQLNKDDATSITLEEICSDGALPAGDRFNGDGVITGSSPDDEKLTAWIADIISCTGGIADRSGEPGINAESVALFSAQAAEFLQWKCHEHSGLMSEPQLILWQELKSKIDDYFLRCSMSSYDSRAAALLNSSDDSLAALSPRNLDEAKSEIALLPLSAVTPSAILSLKSGINPAWIDAVKRFRLEIIEPMLGATSDLSAEQWCELKRLAAPAETWWNSRVDNPVCALGAERLIEWGETGVDAALLDLIDRDLALKPAVDALSELEKLARYCRYLLPLANNFVSFRDFYTKRGKSIFQTGVLYLDGRSFDLCITVNDIARHALIANQSKVYLAYCECVRNGGNDKMTIAAAITNGNSDQLMVGRNGVFYDRDNLDWNATIVRIVEHPVSIREALWSPYKSFGKMVGETIQKMAAARSRANEDRAAARLAVSAVSKPESKPPEPPFDVGKFAGIFAAIGLAIGAIGTAIVSAITGFFKLAWWQMPLVVIAIMLLISGPAIILAWLKLRQRNLGRLLDPNGWAVNTRAMINIPFGASLTGLPHLPEGSARSINDPFAEKKKGKTLWIGVAIIIAVIIAIWRILSP